MINSCVRKLRYSFSELVRGGQIVSQDACKEFEEALDEAFLEGGYNDV
jgi:hypothetical protein